MSDMEICRQLLPLRVLLEQAEYLCPSGSRIHDSLLTLGNESWRAGVTLVRNAKNQPLFRTDAHECG
jgi:hypothetical protein